MAKTFGELLRTHRREAGKTLGDVARRLKLSVAYLSDVERGRRDPLSNEYILSIAEFLEIDPSHLLGSAASQRGLLSGGAFDESLQRLSGKVVFKLRQLTQADRARIERIIDKY